MTDHSIIPPTDEPLTSVDLAICQRVFETVCVRQDARKRSEEENRIAAITIELYRQGVRNEDHLRDMVGAARGAIPFKRPD